MTDSIEIPTYPALAELMGPELWTRGQPRIRDNAVELTTFEVYDPRTPHVGRALLLDLANIRNSGGVTAFARRYGLLLTREPKPGSSEPVLDWLVRAREVRGALTMHICARNLPDPNASEADDRVVQKLRDSIAPFRERLGAEGRAFLDQHTLDHQAAILVAEIVNANLPRQQIIATPLLEQRDEHGTWRVATGARARYMWGPKCDTLVEFAHHMLALTLTERLPVRLCQGCPRLFVPHPPNKHYHDERCANAARQRNKRRAND